MRPGRDMTGPALEPPHRNTDANGVFRASAAMLGCFLGLALLKFGNPVILDHMIEPPTGFWEFLIQPWPLRWGYALLGGIAVFVTVQWLVRRRSEFRDPRASTDDNVNGARRLFGRWLGWLPILWLSWQVL